MKKLILLLCLLFIGLATFAQQTDSLAYQLQRKKVNNLLGKRSIKFNQYFQSLDMHTGIFGLQTKKDIRRSNEILMDIVQTDNAVFKELKILLDYRTTVQSQVLDRSKESENRNTSFMGTINKLRNQTEKLQAEAEQYHKEAENLKKLLFVAAALILLLTFLIIRIKSSKRR
ncbi:hypothetical protein [Mucilaginibacter arboris]|uniref:Uncharacterized protein n=1 Tax=Mucilaginibacter arboris TaxID=2682090 RepID=A0A7K1SXK1_9SPHI|nr:hypothetical protein [Mucilaginibacter arboris]MVN21978.1 hypothetical protein [Mucilaginibacter arboris]